MVNNLMILLLSLGFIFQANASGDDVLFKIDNTPVKVSEFEYIYNKNNFDNKADYSEKSIREYLELYINFRLKVKEAESLGLDKDSKLQSELKVYQEQLYNSFYDKNTLKSLIDEAIERSKYDVSISHIFISVPVDASLQEKTEAERKIQNAYELLQSGNSFSDVAKKLSDDRYTKENGGLLGYFTALQIAFYNLENTAYNTPVGSYSKPIETPIGFHIVKVNDKRPARGEVKVALIKLNKSSDDKANNAVKTKINTIYQSLKDGGDFKALATLESEDANTKGKGGELDFFAISQYDPIFEENAFALSTKGDISQPFETQNAWYILKLIDKKLPGEYPDFKDELVSKIKKSDRYTIKREAYILDVLNRHGFSLKDPGFKNFRAKAIDQFKIHDYKFTIDNPVPIMEIVGVTYTNADLATYLSNYHLKYRKLDANQKFDRLYHDFLEEKTIDFHILAYGNENEEYGSLLKEYRDGILLFDLMEKKVWSKAVEDSIGLKDYYNNNKSKFLTKEKADIRKYSAPNEKAANLLVKYLKLDPDMINTKYLKKLESKGVTSSYEQLSAEKTDELSKKVIWKDNGLKVVTDDNNYAVYQTFQIFPVRERSFDESKGFAIAGYQEFLEKQWLKELRQKYNVVIDEAVLKGLIK
ncbi:MAG: peptidylprolyl isomerase [Chitinophagales bacterium]